MNQEDRNRLLLSILNHTPEVKLRAGKQYAHGRTEPGGLISVAALKDRIRVSFITEGKANDTPADRFLEWVNESGIMSTKAFGDTGFLLSEGAKNPDKREISAEITFEARSEDEIVRDSVAAYNALLEKLSGSFEPKAMGAAKLNGQSDEEPTESREIAFTFLYSNGDTGEDYEEESWYILKSQNQKLQESLHDWLNLRDEETLKRFAIDLIGNPTFNGCEGYGVAFEELKDLFFWRGVDKLGWGDVMVQIFDISVDGKELDLSEIEMETLGEELKLQLVNDANPDMYMIDCEL